MPVLIAAASYYRLLLESTKQLGKPESGAECPLIAGMPGINMGN
jgi:hypothetical protein